MDALKIYEASQKVWIDEGHLRTFIDLFKQIEQLELPSGRKPIKSDHQIIFPKMIGKYFTHAGKDIPLDTSRNYYVSQKEDMPSKGTFIQLEHRFFKIVSANETKK